jgi:hypothetical protein
MRTSRQPSTTKVLLALASFVVAVGAVSWLVTGGPGLRAAPPPDGPALTATPGVTPIPLDCAANELELVGAFNECVAPVPYSAEPCSVSGHILDVTLRLGVGSFGAFLYIEVNGPFDGPGTYELPPWAHPLGTANDQPKVAVQQDGTSAYSRSINGVSVQQYGTDLFWQSAAGVLVVTGRDGRSGTVSAILEQSAGHNATVLGTELSVSGAWNCP